MFQWIKDMFTEQKPGAITQGESTMSNTAKITRASNGKFVLFTRNATIGTYSRKRDAVRGAARRGLTVA